MVTVSTFPGGGIFEATVRVGEKVEIKIKKNSSSSLKQLLKVEGGVSRLNLYGNTSWCVKDARLRLYCYCIEQKRKDTNENT